MWFSKNKNKLHKGRIYRIERPKTKYKNPLSLKKSILKLKALKIINIILLIGIVCGLYFFLFSSFYNITDIQVAGNKIASTDDILDVTNSYLNQNRLLILKNRNIFLFGKNGLNNKINEVIILDDLVINKILPNTLKLTLVEKDAAVKWVSAGKEYLIDSNGQIIKKYYKLETPEIFAMTGDSTTAAAPIIEDKFTKLVNLSNQTVNLGDQVLSMDNMAFIKQLLDKLSQNGYQIREIDMPNAFPQYLSVVMVKDWQIHFSLKDTLEAQLSRLNLLVDQKINKTNLDSLDYIDLRLGESIYYKFKGQEQAKP